MDWPFVEDFFLRLPLLKKQILKNETLSLTYAVFRIRNRVFCSVSDLFFGFGPFQYFKLETAVDNDSHALIRLDYLFQSTHAQSMVLI